MRWVIVLPVLLLLAACEPAPLHLRVTSVRGELLAEVYEKWWFGVRSSEVPCVHDVELTRSAGSQVLWRMKVNPDRQCGDLKSFEVGRAPEGFRDEVRLSGPLPSGAYRLTAYGIGFGAYDFTVPLRS